MSTLNALTSGGGVALSGDTSGNLVIQSAGTNTAVFTTGSLVGIGTTTPSAKLHVTQTGNPVAQFTRSDSGVGLVIAGDSDGPYFRPETNTAIRFNNSANSAEYMRIDSSGNLLVGTTSNLSVASKVQVSTSASIAYLYTSSTGSDGCYVDIAGNNKFFEFRKAGVEKGSITTNGSTTAYNTNSDYRLKENIAPMAGALAIVSALKPVTYKWKETGEESQGFIAHELQAVVPDCVVGEKDAVDSEGKPVYQGIDTSFLVATLTAAIQELNAKVEAQALEIQALKGVA